MLTITFKKDGAGYIAGPHIHAGYIPGAEHLMLLKRINNDSSQANVGLFFPYFKDLIDLEAFKIGKESLVEKIAYQRVIKLVNSPF